MNSILIHNIEMSQIRLKHLFGFNTKLPHFIIIGVILISLIHTSYAQTQSELGNQVTLSDDLNNDPVAQDILKKIEQTKKMIEELKQKEFQNNQAQENLKSMRDMSDEYLNQDLDEWDKLWEKNSPKNSFESFVSKKPSYVQGVFWDQFDFKEQKVNAGRDAMNNVLASGGTMQEARDAFNKAASTKRIELIEMNAQFNVKHNLADYEEQQLFNSTGQIHISPATQMKLANLYTDYKLQPSYILANSEDKNISKLNSEVNSNTICEDGYVLVSRVTTGSHACIDESTAKKWINNGIKEITFAGKISENISPISDVKTNPGTKCDEGYRTIFHIAESEYQCVLESVAKKMMENNTAEVHTLTEYILNKDIQKMNNDVIFEINQEILNIQEEYDIKMKALASEYDDRLEDQDSISKQKKQEIIKEYQTSTNITKEDVTKRILNERKTNDSNKEKILEEKSDAISKLELELKNKILEMVKGHEHNPQIKVDWSYLL